MDPRLFEVIVCPVCKGPLKHEHQAQRLICEHDQLVFPIRDGIAVMIAAEASPLQAPSAQTASSIANSQD